MPRRGMGKRAATALLDSGVTWEQLKALIDSVDREAILEEPGRSNKSMPLYRAYDIYYAALDDATRVGHVAVWRHDPYRPGRRKRTGAFLLARNILRDFGPLEARE